MILRYPGGKKKVAKELVRALLAGGEIQEFREPYCGSAAVTFTLLANSNFHGRVWINDLDPGISALWTAVIQEPDALIQRVLEFTPTVDAFREFKTCLLEQVSLPIVELGFRKLATHQMSFSGLGTRAGSPIGGWSQGPDNPKTYEVGCRWTPKTLEKNIRKLHDLMKGRVECTQLDALEVIRAPGEGVVLYLDPPYVKEGINLYQFAYDGDFPHRQLAQALRDCPHRWMVSYDDHPLVHDLYQGYAIHETKWAYTINSQKEHSGTEVLILNGVETPFPKVSLIEELFG